MHSSLWESSHRLPRILAGCVLQPHCQCIRWLSLCDSTKMKKKQRVENKDMLHVAFASPPSDACDQNLCGNGLYRTTFINMLIWLHIYISPWILEQSCYIFGIDNLVAMCVAELIGCYDAWPKTKKQPSPAPKQVTHDRELRHCCNHFFTNYLMSKSWVRQGFSKACWFVYGKTRPSFLRMWASNLENRVRLWTVGEFRLHFAFVLYKNGVHANDHT